MEIYHICYKCGYKGFVTTNDKKIMCPNCRTKNDWWDVNENPPPNHIEERV